jgi:hypothetical protein
MNCIHGRTLAGELRSPKKLVPRTPLNPYEVGPFPTLKATRLRRVATASNDSSLKTLTFSDKRKRSAGLRDLR